MKGRQATLARIHRVRGIQLGLARADEVRAQEALASEHALTRRIADLVTAVAPAPEATGAHALAAAAFYRERLQQSAHAATSRLTMAEQRSERATEARRAARRDESAVEKLMDRARLVALAKEARELQDAPGQAKGKRHDPC